VLQKKTLLLTYKNSDRLLAAIRRFHPEWVDLDVHQGHLRSQISCKVLASTHHNEEPPDFAHDAFKRAAVTESPIDALSCLPIGERSSFARFLYPLVYAATETPIAAGQPTLETLSGLALGGTPYGLLGNPVSQSISFETHNPLLKPLNALYVKICLEEHELGPFLQKATMFGGFSVTIPFKVRIIPHLKGLLPCAQRTGAVNTLLPGWIGANTDYLALQELLPDVPSVRIIGRGGAAKAVRTVLEDRGTPIHESGSYIINATPADYACDFDMRLHTLTGRQLFAHQAAHQMRLWFGIYPLQQLQSAARTVRNDEICTRTLDRC
jgi:hypothetical protein